MQQLQRQVQTVAAPARGKHPHVAAGARILATGLTASAVFGLTSVLAQASQPTTGSTPAEPVDVVSLIRGGPLGGLSYR